MFPYITKELPELISNFFPVDRANKSITGFSMGGHGALISALKTGKYRSLQTTVKLADHFVMVGNYLRIALSNCLQIIIVHFEALI
jgi:S-formylglutathione hydrolase FrmB